MIHRNYYGQPYPQGTFNDPKTRLEEEGEPPCHECGALDADNDVTIPGKYDDIVVYYCDECYERIMNQENQ